MYLPVVAVAVDFVVVSYADVGAETVIGSHAYLEEVIYRSIEENNRIRY